jgi:dienelactone hydrolase
MKPLAFAVALLLPVMASFAEVQMQTVEYKDGDVTCKGVLVWDQGPAGGKPVPKPGVLIIPEWWGINDYMKTRAKQVVELGYVAFIADMYGDGKVTADVKQAAEWSKLRDDRPKFRARALAGLEAFRKNATGLDSTRIAAIGYCFGGTGVLEMARGGADLKGVVSFHGGLNMPGPAPAAITAKILVCHGADDPMVPPEQVQGLVSELQKAKADYQVIWYANSLHAFTNPDADKLKIPGIGYNKLADTRSWEAMKLFLAEVFAG